MTILSDAPLRLDPLVAQVCGPDRGAVTTFLGLVRNHHGGRGVRELGYSAYRPMAESVSLEIIAEAESRWPVRVALQHRIGNLSIGDIAVAIAVGGAHREESFAACRYVIEELKHRVPVWKQEFFSDGGVEWVDPTASGVR